jgi:deazaflavin-dependent oxidoreductase (nitroreductase family)
MHSIRTSLASPTPASPILGAPTLGTPTRHLKGSMGPMTEPFPETRRDSFPETRRDSFPETHWGSETLSPAFAPAYAFASSRLGSRVLRALAPIDRRVVLATKGKYTLFGPTTLPTLLLTTIGRKSGLPRACALNFLRDGRRLLILGSNWGQQQHPDWSANLLARPDATVAIGGREIAVTATELTGQDRDAALQRFLGYPMYRAYRGRTNRELRLFALSRRED